MPSLAGDESLPPSNLGQVPVLAPPSAMFSPRQRAASGHGRVGRSRHRSRSRSVMNPWAAPGMAWSSVATTAPEGSVFHAGGPWSSAVRAPLAVHTGDPADRIHGTAFTPTVTDLKARRRLRSRRLHPHPDHPRLRQHRLDLRRILNNNTPGPTRNPALPQRNQSAKFRKGDSHQRVSRKKNACGTSHPGRSATPLRSRLAGRDWSSSQRPRTTSPRT
jgi:hypothetical protein